MILILTATFLNTMGYQAFIPTFPLYLHFRGASVFVIGFVAAAALLCYGLAQYPAGWLADRFDRRRVVAVATSIYALFFIPYLFPLPLGFLVPYRLAHAAVGGMYTPAALALVADVTPRGAISRSFGLWQVATMSGFLLGPLFGGLLAAANLRLVFVGAGVVCVLAAVPVVAIRSAVPRSKISDQLAPPTRAVSMPRRLLPAIGVGSAPEYFTGLLTGIWSLYLLSRGALTWQIGLSFTLFALPAVFLSVGMGGLIDHRGARVVMATSLIGLAVVSPLLGMTPVVPLLLLLVLVSGIFAAAERPAVYSEVSMRVPHGELARAQGLVQMALMIAQTAGAVTGGWLLSRSLTMPFLSVTAACLLSLVAVPFLSPRRSSA
jgi:MFS family permease